VAAGIEPRVNEYNDGFLSPFFLPYADEQREVTGFPELPAKWRAYLQHIYPRCWRRRQDTNRKRRDRRDGGG